MARTATVRGSRSKIDGFGGLQPIPPSSPDPGSDPGPAARSRSDFVRGSGQQPAELATNAPPRQQFPPFLCGYKNLAPYAKSVLTVWFSFGLIMGARAKRPATKIRSAKQ